MNSAEASSHGALGFLTILEHDQQGFVGGYLILNTAGRPLEFHCTAPVRPTRAQQILFGPTLDSYLFGEQIGQTLVSKGSIEPAAVCTDVEMALSVREYVTLPVALVLRPEELSTQVSTDTIAEGGTSEWRVDAQHAFGPHLHRSSLAAIGWRSRRGATPTCN